MKLLAGVAIAALLIASPAMAQTDAAPAQCGTIGAAPTDAPDGATATAQQVEAFTQRFNAWAEATNAVLSCKRARAEAARAQADALTLEFNTENNGLREAIAGWQAEVDEFNARAPQRPNRGRSQRSITD